MGSDSYRLMLFDRPMGAWRATKAEAFNDAIARRLGSREPWSKVTYLGVGVWIQVEQNRQASSSPPTPIVEASGLREVADLSGRTTGIAICASAANDAPAIRTRSTWPRRGRG